MSVKFRGRAATLAVMATFGPLTGPLVSRMMVNWRRGDRILAAIYGAAILETAFLLPVFATHLVRLQLA